MADRQGMPTAADLYRLVGEYLADPRLQVRSFHAQSRGVRLSVADAESIRYAHSLITPGSYFYVGTCAFEQEQVVTVTLTGRAGVYVTVSLAVTDPVTVARLRALPDRPTPVQVLTALPVAPSDLPGEAA